MFASLAGGSSFVAPKKAPERTIRVGENLGVDMANVLGARDTGGSACVLRWMYLSTKEKKKKTGRYQKKKTSEFLIYFYTTSVHTNDRLGILFLSKQFGRIVLVPDPRARRCYTLQQLGVFLFVFFLSVRLFRGVGRAICADCPMLYDPQTRSYLILCSLAEEGHRDTSGLPA